MMGIPFYADVLGTVVYFSFKNDWCINGKHPLSVWVDRGDWTIFLFVVYLQGIMGAVV